MPKYLIIAFALFLSACGSVQIKEATSIQPPAGVSSHKLETAICDGIGKTRGWVIETKKPGAVVAGLHSQQHYLQVTYEYTSSKVSSKITASENLNQEGDKIHKRAIGWQQRLDTSVYREISMLK
ncbi:MAG: hypothetical protein P4L87_03045 [Formivibrio sp.]|nr:hypothetical protein [Formivibrio sp.]